MMYEDKDTVRMMAGVMPADEEFHGKWTGHRWKQQRV
jgi:hypothetical protein